MAVEFLEPMQREPYALLDEHDWYRLGVEADGSCFFYCMLIAIDEAAREMSTGQRTDYVKRVRKDISENIDTATWKSLSHGLVAMLGVQELFLANCVHKLYHASSTHQSVVCRSVLPYTYMEQTFIPAVYEEAYKHGSDSNMLDTIRTSIERKLTEYYNDSTVRTLFQSVSHVNPNVIAQKRQSVYEYLKQLLERIWDESVDEAFRRYVRNIAHLNVPVDTYIMGALGSYFKRNVIIIDHDTGTPYPCANIQDKYDNTLPYIIIVWLNTTHFELLYRANGESSREFEFMHDDPIVIKCMDTLIMNT